MKLKPPVAAGLAAPNRPVVCWGAPNEKPVPPVEVAVPKPVAAGLLPNKPPA